MNNTVFHNAAALQGVELEKHGFFIYHVTVKNLLFEAFVHWAYDFTKSEELSIWCPITLTIIFIPFSSLPLGFPVTSEFPEANFPSFIPPNPWEKKGGKADPGVLLSGNFLA